MALLRGQEDRLPGHFYRSLSCLGRVAYLQRCVGAAGAHLREALAGMVRHQALNLLPDCLEWLAPVVSECVSPATAARLLGAANRTPRSHTPVDMGHDVSELV